LKVIGRSSSFRFKGGGHDSKIIGESLGVDTLLEGTVRRQGERVRIVAELVNAADGRELWSQTYDRELKDIFAVQSGIAQAVADSLKVKLMSSHAGSASKHHVPSFETYDHFLLGRQLLARGDPQHTTKAVEAFRQAVALDPDYAEAYSGLAMAESFAVEGNEDANLVALGNRRAMAAAERAVALDPELGDAYGSRGYLRGTNDWNWNGAEADLLKAVSLDPGDGRNQLRYGYLLATLNRLPEAIAALGKCVDHDPLFPPCWFWLGRIKAAQADYEGARQTMKRVLAIDPEYKVASTYLGILSLLQGDPATAREVFVKLDRLSGLAMAEHDLGHAAQSKSALDQLIAAHAMDGAYQIATVYAWSGDRDQAFAWLERAIKQHDIGLMNLTYDPLWRGLRADPRFAAFCQKMGLAMPSRKATELISQA
jgi:serine/threonine-protein kinase